MHVRKSFAAALAVLVWGWSAADAEQYTIPLFPAPGASGDPQSVLRIVNNTGEAATVQVFAIADDGTRSGPATIALGATAAVEFDATELQSANAAKGLGGGLGSLSGDVRLSIDSDAPVVPLALVRASDGTLSAMHDTVRPASDAGEQYRYEIPVFNLSTDVTQASRLRLINPGDTSAALTIAGRDDGGAVAGGGDVTLTLPAGGARTLTAQQLEAGDAAMTGRLGAATGGWRLTVSSDRPLQVVNIVVSSTGYWNNLSTTAVRGAAPADLAGFNDRFVGESAVLEVEGGRFALVFMENGRFSETMQTDGMFATSEGGYDYVGLGPDAGRLTLEYDDGSQCRTNLYFSSRASGWFASRCAGGVDPDESWSGGNWFVGDDEDDGGSADPVETTYGMDEALPGVPTSGQFSPARLSGGSVRGSGGSTTIDLNDGGYIELNDGTRYTCASAGGCEIVDGTVTRGSVTGRTSGSGDGEIDRFPVFPTEGRPGDRMYTVGTAIDALTLPEATGGNAPLTYSLSPDVPGLSFDAAARRLTGTPTAAGSYAMSYTVTDVDGDLYTFHLTIEVGAGEADDHGDTFDTATTVSIPSTTPGELEEGKEDGDRDYFRMVVAAARTLTVETTGNTDTYGTLFDNSRTQLAMNDDGGSSTNFRIERQVQAGTYYVEVRGFRPSRTGPYELRVSAADDTSGGGDAPSGPQNISVTREGSSVRVSWDASPGATRYEVWRCDTRAGPLECEDGIFFDRSNWTNLARSVTDTSYVDRNPPTSTSIIPFDIHYVVQACNRSGCSGILALDGGDEGGGNSSAPDLVVESARTSDATPSAGASFTLSATVRNRGDGQSGSTTLRYYRSTNATISTSDTAANTDAVGPLAASGTSAESVRLTAPSSAGTYYYGACVDSVSDESDTANNCSSAVRVTVSGGTDPQPDSYQPLAGLRVLQGGAVQYNAGGIILSAGAGRCISLSGSSFNGVTYTAHTSKWQRRAGAGSPWMDVSGTERQGALCGYNPTASGEYRLVADMTIGGRRGSYSSENTVVVD